jgi:serine/threonine protein kinase
MPLATGQVLKDRYRVVKLLAQGGFGAVYRAWDLNLKNVVALKENLSTSPESVKQFTLEARLLANLRQENLPYIIDYFSLPDQGQYLVMEFVEGQDLQSMLQESGKPLHPGMRCPDLSAFPNSTGNPPRYQTSEYQDHSQRGGDAGRLWHSQGLRPI